MKIKSFTLIEILIASVIFMGVMVIAASSFALVRRSSEKAEDIRVASTCARQVEDFIKSQTISSNYGGRIMALSGCTPNGASPGLSCKLYPPASSEGQADLYGVAFFLNETTYKILYKYVPVDKSDAGYYLDEKSTGTFNFGAVKDVNVNGKLLHSSSCKAINSNVTGGNDSPFKIDYSMRFPAPTLSATSAPSDAQISKMVFEISLDDVLFNYLYDTTTPTPLPPTPDDFKEQAEQAWKTSNTAERVFIKVTNSLNAI